MQHLAPASRRSVVLLALTLAACAVFAPRFAAPQLSIVGVEVQQSDLWSQRLKIRMHVQNPNNRALPVSGLTFRLEVAGEDFAQGGAANEFTVPAMGESEFDAIVTANAAGALLKLLGRHGEKRGDAIEYRLVGKVSLASGFMRSIPFEERGEFRLR